MRKKTSGFTLIEMLVGIVIGMIVVAAASVMMVTVLKSQKDVTASASLNQELGAAMAVMSNEIRRVGFSVCDPVANDCNNDGVIDSNDVDNPVDYAIGEDIKVVGGNCIEYRYNADVDDAANDSEERRGFRLNGDFIEMAGSAGDVSCGSNDNWVPLTDPAVMKVSAIPGFTLFSTAGSKCRNMTKNMYWVVGGNAIGLACDADTLLSGDCVDLNDPVVTGLCDTGPATVKDNSEWVNDDTTDPDYPKYTLFGVNQIRVKLRATLTRDPAVSKNLQTSVKIANPWIQVKKP